MAGLDNELDKRKENHRLKQRKRIDNGFESDNGGAAKAAAASNWVVSYADIINVLLCFFIIFFNFDKANQGDLTKLKVKLREDLEVDENFSAKNQNSPKTTDPRNLTKEPIDQVYEKIKDATSGTGGDGMYAIVKRDQIEVTISDDQLFAPGSHLVSRKRRPLVDRIIRTIVDQEQHFFVDVEGHTDSTPIRTSVFGSNWELSSARAAGIVRLFLSYGMSSARLRAVGYADSAPLYNEIDAEGNPVLKHRALNRRIVLRVRKDLRMEEEAEDKK